MKIGTAEIVQTFASPAEKLNEAISGVIEKVFESKFIEKMTDAKAYQLKVL